MYNLEIQLTVGLTVTYACEDGRLFLLGIQILRKERREPFSDGHLIKRESVQVSIFFFFFYMFGGKIKSFHSLFVIYKLSFDEDLALFACSKNHSS